MKSTKQILFDSQAILKWTQKEPGYQKVNPAPRVKTRGFMGCGVKSLMIACRDHKAEYTISFADCFAAATALKYHATILTGDPEFRKLGRMVSVECI
jgi:ribonuclease VapC